MESCKNEKDNRKKSNSPDDISSKAVVKYEEPVLQVLKSYIQLEEYTNLNTAPSNWLKENIYGSFTEQPNPNFSTHKNGSLDFSSLLMAGRHPDMFAEVDVVSSARHIKKLLKTPFNLNSSYSMTVHRIGKSLFLNDFDVPVFLKTNKTNTGNCSNLQWLYDLYCSANDNSSKNVYPKKRNKELSQLQNIESKFMYYSIGADSCKQDNATEFVEASQENRRSSICDIQNDSRKPPSPVKGTSEGEFPDRSCFLRDIFWTFEDITMLVGSDLPIFGGGRYPAVSLRLRDSAKPINILTGIDYWLDNLMCNVPELMMCYHIEGIVQKYEKIKTGELPHIKESQFSPNVVKDVAQNILSFLKSNCTQEGHTYWLFKSSKDDVVKLYDLTSISLGNNGEDPFSGSVAFLLYKIAYNMYVSTNFKEKNIPKLVTLLHNCISLLDTVNKPEILLMASYILSDLYTHSITEKSFSTKQFEKEEISDTESPYMTDDDLSESERPPEQVSVKINNLCVPNSVPRKANKVESVNDNLNEEEKCKRAIAAAIQGLTILLNKTRAYLSENKVNQEDPANIGAISPLTKPFEKTDPVLAMPSLCNGMQTIKPFSSTGMTCILFEKVAKSYLALVNISLAKEKFGRALRFLQITFNCLSSANQETVANTDLSVKALMFYGDILTLFASKKFNKESEKEEFYNANKNDENMSLFFENLKEVNCFNISVVSINKCFEWTVEKLLKSALEVYKGSLENTKNETEDNVAQVQFILDVTRRLGNVENEIGVMYLNQATSIATQYGKPSDTELRLFGEIFVRFENGIRMFEFVKDKANMALLYSNTAKLMRLCATVFGNTTKSSSEGKRSQFTVEEQTYFNKAFEYYQKALSLVQSTDEQSPIANNVLMELSGTYFNMASLMQENAPLSFLSEEKIVKDISSAFMKSLQYAEDVSPGNEQLRKQVTNQVGSIHQKLASLYHHVLRNQISDHGKKNYRSLTELHYNKVYKTQFARLHPVHGFKSIMEHLAFLDYMLEQGYSTKYLKSKQDLLFNNLFLQEAITTLKCLAETTTDSNDGEIDGESVDKISSMVNWLHGQLSDTMKETIKYLKTKQYSNFCKIDLKIAKRMFEVVIRGSVAKLSNAKEKLQSISETLLALNEIYKQIV